VQHSSNSHLLSHIGPKATWTAQQSCVHRVQPCRCEAILLHIGLNVSFNCMRLTAVLMSALTNAVADGDGPSSARNHKKCCTPAAFNDLDSSLAWPVQTSCLAGPAASRVRRPGDALRSLESDRGGRGLGASHRASQPLCPPCWPCEAVEIDEAAAGSARLSPGAAASLRGGAAKRRRRLL